MTTIPPAPFPRKGVTIYEPLARLLPRSLLWRTFLLIALLMLLSVAAWFAIFRTYEREPRAQQLAQTLVSVVNLTRTALVTARPDARRELVRELSEREGIHIYPAETSDQIAPLPDRAFLRRVEELVKAQLGPDTRLTLERDGEHALFVSFRIDEGAEGDFWLALPRERIDRIFPIEWLGWGIAALLLSLAGAWLVVFHITRPLKALQHAAQAVGLSEEPPSLAEDGPTEIATVARAFNQMNANLKQIDQDRALILAGISHDLRTPLTRLRMGIEMTGDVDLREGMTADVEEMDKTIGQFLDFARSDGGEPQQPLDPALLLTELAAQYQRRGFAVAFTAPATRLQVTARPQAIRRAVTNLIDNALRYSNTGSVVALSLATENNDTIIAVSDRGPGIPDTEIERMKQPFTRLDSARSNTTGAGLGLAIVERIARSHNGTLELLPHGGGGLVARIKLPAPGGVAY